ncbi:hypothetical protein CL1_0244 [Thermococcus cleftensis]|uniref:DUF4405 domain-containing protein n=1 Tax=Thermococcus cleftensis (strain DSM 27260 / KACC 17922 / CL1) TaxID=163003 RepID=I3ZRX2_THECF|nr:translation initiation factor IF-2 N-terminal domain-containing protein [Thermococcus cleftensis]AFL94456.1 hypothetical protein CL1_0244 [Thermococcus cleftensis]
MRASALVRGVIDLLLTVVFAIVLVTGIGLYLAPSGRIADTIGWTFLGMDKDTLTNVHTYFGFAMAGLVSIHLAIGLKSMWVMLKSAFRGSRFKVAAAFVIPLLLLAAGYQAFATYVVEEEEESTDYTYEDYSYEDNTTVYITGTMMKYYTFEQLAQEFNVPVTDLLEQLKERGIEASANDTLAEIEYEYDLDREEFKAMLEEIITELRGEEG